MKTLLRACLAPLLLCLAVLAQADDAPLTEAAVRTTIAAMDEAVRNRDTQGVLSQIADDAVMVVHAMADRGRTTVTLSRSEYGRSLAQLFAAASEYSMRRDKLQIRIAPDGRSAQVSEVQIEKAVINGQAVTTSTESVSEIRLVGGRPLIVRGEALQVGDGAASGSR